MDYNFVLFLFIGTVKNPRLGHFDSARVALLVLERIQVFLLGVLNHLDGLVEVVHDVGGCSLCRGVDATELTKDASLGFGIIS